MPTPLLLSIFPTFAVGGAQARFCALANHLGTGCRHAIVSMDGATAARDRIDPGIEVRIVDPGNKPGDTVGNVVRFRAAMAAVAPTTMLTHNFGSIEWAMANRLGRLRHVHVEDGFGPEERHRQIPRRVWLRRFFLRGRTVVLPSRTLERIALEEWRLPPRQVTYLPNGIDLARFSAKDAAANPERESLLVGTVAALRPEKNVGRLVRAFAIAARGTPHKLAIAGDGPERAMLEALAEQHGVADQVLFLGHLANPAGLLATFDVFALSSDTEQMPISLLEAMATGLPVVATDVGDVAAMMGPAQRPYVRPPTDEDMAHGLAAMLAHPGERARLGAANRRMAEEAFGQDAMFARWTHLLFPDA